MCLPVPPNNPQAQWHSKSCTKNGHDEKHISIVRATAVWQQCRWFFWTEIAWLVVLKAQTGLATWGRRDLTGCFDRPQRPGSDWSMLAEVPQSFMGSNRSVRSSKQQIVQQPKAPDLVAFRPILVKNRTWPGSFANQRSVRCFGCFRSLDSSRWN